MAEVLGTCRCNTGESVPARSVDLRQSTLWGQSVATCLSAGSCEVGWGRSTCMKGSVNLSAPTRGIDVGTTSTVWKICYCWGISNVLAKSRPSSLLNLSDHFWSSASILLSAEDLEGLMSVEDLAGLLPNDLVDLEGEAAFFLLFYFITLLPGDFTVPWPSTTPDTRAGSPKRN